MDVFSAVSLWLLPSDILEEPLLLLSVGAVVVSAFSLLALPSDMVEELLLELLMGTVFRLAVELFRQRTVPMFFFRRRLAALSLGLCVLISPNDNVAPGATILRTKLRRLSR